MKLGGRRAGTQTLFIDTSADEVLLQVVVDSEGISLVAFKLYNALGHLVQESAEPQLYPGGLMVRSPEDDEILLEIPPEQDENLTYHLYNHRGQLLTASDGKRTQIFGHLRMDGKSVAKPGRRPAGEPQSEPAV